MHRRARSFHVGICLLLAVLVLTPAIVIAQQRGARRGPVPARAPAPARSAARSEKLLTGPSMYAPGETIQYVEAGGKGR